MFRTQSGDSVSASKQAISYVGKLAALATRSPVAHTTSTAGAVDLNNPVRLATSQYKCVRTRSTSSSASIHVPIKLGLHKRVAHSVNLRHYCRGRHLFLHRNRDEQWETKAFTTAQTQHAHSVGMSAQVTQTIRLTDTDSLLVSGNE